MADEKQVSVTTTQPAATPHVASEIPFVWETEKILIAAVIAFGLNMLLNLWLHWWRRPILKVRASSLVDTKIPHGNDQTNSHPAKYVRIAVENTGSTVGNNCIVYLVDIQEIKDGNLFDIGYEDTIRLRWAYEPWERSESGGIHEGLALQRGVPLYFDLVSTKGALDGNGQVVHHIIELHINRKPNTRYESILKPDTDYRFTVVVSADNAEPVKASWDIGFGSTYQSLKVGEFKLLR